MKLGAKELRTTKPTPEEFVKIKKNPIYIILDNVLDTYNIGAIFRLADAVAAEKVIICGESETPPHTRIKKASINTTEWVDWGYAQTAVEALQKLKIKNEKLKIVAIEQHPRAVSYDQYDYSFPLALVVGHESRGVSPEVLKIADGVVELPMFGVNKSLNVMVSLGIVLYKAIEKISNV
ncbi:MAG: TrmH family RNA methyltransferase [Candidatus Levybacteria bacterium]|nr:TrmH family RNA methyltransferase [Candidatus Levybacteria bacterium]